MTRAPHTLPVAAAVATCLVLAACDPGAVDAPPGTADVGTTLDAVPGTPDVSPQPDGTPGPGPDGGRGGTPGAPCPDDLELFRTTVWQPVLAGACSACHTSEGVAKATRFVLVPDDGGDTWLADNHATFAELALETTSGGAPTVVAKPTLTHPDGHGGGMVLEPGGDAAEGLAFYAAWLRGDLDSCSPTGSCTEDLAGPRLLRRLTHSQYDRTVEDLLGVASGFGETFAADDVVRGFHNNAGALRVSKLLADQYRAAAEALAEQALTFQRAQIVTCDPVEAGQALCAAQIVRDLGQRAFRRPLTDDEVDAYWQLWDAVAVDDGFDTGVQWVVAALLQSPHFLYRQELGAATGGGTYALTDWEVATELSYLVWDTMPDGLLFEAAAAGELHTPEQIAQQLERLLADPRAARMTAGFVTEWLHLDQLNGVPKSMQDFPALSFDIRDLMAGETERLVAHVAASGGTLEALLTAQQTFLTDTLASYYGLAAGDGSADDAGYRLTPLAGTGYGGLLTQGSVTTTFAHPNATSPIKRGVLVRERLLCQELPEPPANVDTTPPAPDPSLTARERYAQHASDPACAGCHDLIDPIGFAFEHYDGAGVYRALDGELAIDASGEIVAGGSASGVFDGVSQLQTRLAEAAEVAECYVAMFVTYATGLHEGAAPACAADRIATEALTEGGGTIGLTEPAARLATSRHFRERSGGAGEGPGSSVGAAPVMLDVYEGLSDGRYPGLDGPGRGGPMSDGVVFELVTQSEWATGYCADGHVTNVSDEDVMWTVVAKVSGTITNLWNATMHQDGPHTVFAGVAWNAVVAAGQTQSFGFCADE